MNNIVDAVNQNSTNAIQAAVLARLFGGAQNNPVMGGVNQAEPPAQDFVSNAMNNPKPTVMPQLAGARGEVSGRGGAMGGIGDALMNMYNSRIARSENEVKQAQEEKAAKQRSDDAFKQFAAEQGIQFKNKVEFEKAKEGFESTIIDNNYKKALTDQIIQKIDRTGKTPIGGFGRSASGVGSIGAVETAGQTPEDLKALQSHWSNVMNTSKNPKEVAIANTRYKLVTGQINAAAKEKERNLGEYLKVSEKLELLTPGTPEYEILSEHKKELESKVRPSSATAPRDNVDDFLTGNPPANKPQQAVAPQEKKYSGEIPTSGGAEVIPVPSTPQGAPRQPGYTESLVKRIGGFASNVGDAMKDLPVISEARLSRAQYKLRNGQPLSPEEQELINKYGGGR